VEADRLVTGVIPGRGQYTEDARVRRLEWLRARTGSALPSLGDTGLDARALTGNVENFAGSVEVPVGLAGPLLFTGDAARGSLVAPLATTEGALVASASRGARALTAAGGVTTKVLSQRMSRAPAFEFADIATAARFTTWLHEHRADLDAQVRLVSRYARLVGVDEYQFGRHLHVRFVFETADAAGQNMTTAATWQICRWMSDTLAGDDRLRPERMLLEGNLSSDKKVSVASVLGGRGTRVTAECVVPAEVVASVLKVTPAAILKGHLTSMLGAQQAGMIGSGINASNIVAALFTATGQDIAGVHESGVSILSMDLDGDDLIATIVLPSLVTGTVGGGTSLPRQREWLTALGCAGAGGGKRFAEIVAGFALALDVSTAAALVSGQFAEAHQRLGRSRRVNWIQPADLDPAFVASATGRPVTAVTLGPALHGDGIASELGALGERRKLTGLIPMTVDWADGDRAELVAKIKPRGEEIVAGIAMVASLCGPEVARAWHRWGAGTEFADSHRRELAVYRRTEPELTDLLPRCHGVLEDEAREAYVVLMERLVLDDRPWTRDRIDRALRAVARVHRHWLGRDDELHGWLHRAPGAAHLVKARELWEALVRYNAAEQPGLLGERRLGIVLDIVDSAGFWTQELEALPRTLVHNDFNPRNVAVLDERVVAYDWELATVGVPERDVAELLTFTLGTDATIADVDHHLAVHGGNPRGYQLALRELLMSRFQLYLAAHSHREFAFLPGVLDTAFHLWDLESSRGGA
jgi:hydroxymethylglutaryl-CoA reductase (NADPH)